MIEQANSDQPSAPLAQRPRRLLRVRWPVAQEPGNWQLIPLRRQDRIERSLEWRPNRSPRRALPPQSPVSTLRVWSDDLGDVSDDALPRWIRVPIDDY